MSVRIGFGYDSHRLAPGGPLVLGGTEIAFDRHFEAHSDGDALLHALTDAILGAIAAGDIGEHFPPSDPKWKDQPSDQFVRHAMGLATQAGYSIVNADLTIVAEVPKLGPHRQIIRQTIADLLGVDLGQISLKAKTNEAMGFVGRQEGIACWAAVLLSK